MKTHKKTFATKAHMMQFWRDFKDELVGCHQVGQVGEYVLKFSIKQESFKLINHQRKYKMIKTYEIIRFRFNGNNKVLKKGLTLEQAQAHCNNEKSAGNGWFDGYNLES